MNTWSIVKLESLTSSDRWAFAIGPFGSKVTTGDYQSEGVPFIRGINLSRGRFFDEEFVFISPSKANEIESSIALPGDLIFTRKGTIGQVSMIPRHPRFEKYAISGSQVKARLDESIAAAEFYHYWFLSPRGRQSLLAHAVTTGVPSLANSLSTIRQLSVPHPPLYEQQAIAAALGALDDKIEINDKIEATAVKLCQSIYRSVTADDFMKTEIGQHFTLKYGKALREPDRHSGNIPVYGCTGQIGWHNSAITETSTVVIGRKGANAGWVSWSPTPCWVIDTAYWVEINTIYLSPEVALLMFETADLPALVGDSAVPGLNRDAAHRHLIQAPSPSAAATVTSRVRPLLHRAAQARTETRVLVELRDALLPQLMSGKLRVRDAERIVEDAV